MHALWRLSVGGPRQGRCLRLPGRCGVMAELRWLVEQSLKLKDDHSAYKYREVWLPCLLDRCIELNIKLDAGRYSNDLSRALGGAYRDEVLE